MEQTAIQSWKITEGIALPAILLNAGANIDGHEDYVRFLLDGEV
jgi:hypothetical protein